MNNLLPRQGADTRARRLESEKNRRQRLVLCQLQFLFGNTLVNHAPHFFQREIKHFVQMFGRRAGIDRENTNIGKRAAACSDRIRKATFFANCLPQPAGRAAADNRSQQARRVTIVIFRIRPGRRDHQMRLLQFLLLLDQNWRRSGG